jgi:hypothetical protein
MGQRVCPQAALVALAGALYGVPQRALLPALFH